MPDTTIDQRRASHAWEVIERVMGMSEDYRNKFATYAKSLPVRIKQAGLGQALLFLFAKSKIDKPDEQSDTHRGIAEILLALGSWVCANDDQKVNINAPLQGRIISSIAEGDTFFLRRATDETLAYVMWINRFAEGKGLKVTDTED